MKRLLYGLAAIIAVIAVIVAIRTARFGSRQVPVETVETIAVDPDAAAERLAQALRFRTVSSQDRRIADRTPFLALHDYFERAFPRVHATLTRETVNELSLLYRWPGRDPALAPILLLAHIDVVPVEPGTEDDWAEPPYDGAIADGYVWGRGALDDKSSALGTLEAIEALIAEGFSPERTVYVAMGHDEEIGGPQGAQAIAARLRARGIEFLFTLDEGGTVTEGLTPGTDRPVAGIGIAEKGFLSLRLVARAEGGHSSRPPERTAIGALARAVARMEENQMRATLDGGVMALYLDRIGPELDLWSRIKYANMWLFESLVLRNLLAEPSTASRIRTTTAPTMLTAGVKENVLPSSATAVVNFRLRPGETLASVIDHIRETVADDGVDIGTLQRFGNEPMTVPRDPSTEDWDRLGRFGNEASPIADVEAAPYRMIAQAIREIDPAIVVVPTMMSGGTDTKHFVDLARDNYRFAFRRLGPSDSARVHGTNERISIGNYVELIKFTGQILKRAAGSAE